MKGLEMVAGVCVCAPTTVALISTLLYVAPSGSGEVLTGSVDWMELLLVARAHPGYYSYAIMKM